MGKISEFHMDLDQRERMERKNKLQLEEKKHFRKENEYGLPHRRKKYDQVSERKVFPEAFGKK